MTRWRPHLAGRRADTRVVVSTHLDDAVLSAYSALSPETTVVTVLAGVPPRGGLAGWDAEGGATDSHDRALERREEDRRALHPTGARAVHLDFADGQYVDAGLLPAPRGADVAESLRPALRRARDVFAPAGTANPEHRFVRDVVLAVRPDAILYADIPYALLASRGGFSPPRDVDMTTRAIRDVELDADLAAQKLESALSYGSQLEQLERYFGDFLNLRALGRERFWYPSRPD